MMARVIGTSMSDLQIASRYSERLLNKYHKDLELCFYHWR